MTPYELELIIRISCFVMGASLVSIVYEFKAIRYLKRIAIAQEKFANDFSEVKK